MKIITANRPWNIDKLFETLQSKLNPIFMEARQMDIQFDIERSGDDIKIGNPQYYDGYLFKITVQGNKLYIAKSEHYVDDVNQITLQSILETLQMDSLDGADITYISGE
ncbi:hypothetical protein HQ865_05105 [Mucilaginibacter mali]|uniref:Uncharacterized protein n=1 Tax=Mucilaginibacter mali TaxID=2740462 RepID=A0A7D4TMH3_9SPHI|nr:hypothetical protein [Mucilaginibacter mali]QKJ29154.1 hypothetical protein HQ865_05105 [Mucilaginibacter mali]